MVVKVFFWLEEFLNAKKNLNCILGLHASINLRL